MADLLLKDLSYKIQGAFYSVYKVFGSAFKESVYHNALLEELRSLGLEVETQKRIDVFYKDKKVGVYVPDLVVEGLVIIELKCKEVLATSDMMQFWQYLKGSEYTVGYLVNFGSSGKVEFIRRVYDRARYR